MIPIVTIIALSFGGLFSGALITETMFAYPGMGKLIFDAVMGNDFNLALAALLLATLVTLPANLAAYIPYACIAPRLTYRHCHPQPHTTYPSEYACPVARCLCQ